jgi:hypothetical protein
MKYDLPNVVIKDVLTKDEINEIFNIVNETTNTGFQGSLCYTMWHITLPQHLIEKFTKYAEEVAGVPLVLKEYNLSRYQKTISDCKKFLFNPMLYPHTDDAFNQDRVTLDYQIRSNISWDLVVDNWESEKSYTLEDNEILTFSGTHQIHWRPKREFKDDEFLEAVFLHFAPLDAKDFTEEHLNKLKEKKDVLFDKWDKTEGLSSNPLVLEQ